MSEAMIGKWERMGPEAPPSHSCQPPIYVNMRQVSVGAVWQCECNRRFLLYDIDQDFTGKGDHLGRYRPMPAPPPPSATPDILEWGG